MAQKTHYEIKQNALKSKNSNTITDSDYVLRDIGSDEDTAKNIIDITPDAFKKPKAQVKSAKSED